MRKYSLRKVQSGVKFDLHADNGEVILSSEVYTSRAACCKGIESIRRNAPLAGVEEGEAARLTHPKFQIFRDRAGEYRFRLTARNGKIIAVSEGYLTHGGCRNGVQSVKNCAPDAQIIEEETI